MFPDSFHLVASCRTRQSGTDHNSRPFRARSVPIRSSLTGASVYASLLIIKPSILVYRVQNLGEMIQTVALSRLLPPAAGVYRASLAGRSGGCHIVIKWSA